MEPLNHCLDTLTLIGLEMLQPDDLLLGMCSTLAVEQLAGHPRGRLLWLCLHVKQNTWEKPKPQRKLYGYTLC